MTDDHGRFDFGEQPAREFSLGAAVPASSPRSNTSTFVFRVRARSEEVGDLLYIQLTAEIEHAWTPMMWEQLLRLWRLMEPVLVW